MDDLARLFLLISVAQPVVTAALATLASLWHRRQTGQWPTLDQWCALAAAVHGKTSDDRAL